MTSRASTLLVEDDEHLAETLAEDFREEGVAVERARTWDEGLDIFRVGAHELVIADYNLPGSEHGLMLLLEVKARMPSTKLVLISGALTEMAEAELEPLGLVDAYFRKTSRIASDLLPWVTDASTRANDPTDWTRFADAHLADPAAVRDDATRINEILRASLSVDE